VVSKLGAAYKLVSAILSPLIFIVAFLVPLTGIILSTTLGAKVLLELETACYTVLPSTTPINSHVTLSSISTYPDSVIPSAWKDIADPPTL
jgi:hypothetical protein